MLLNQKTAIQGMQSTRACILQKVSKDYDKLLFQTVKLQHTLYALRIVEIEIIAKIMTKLRLYGLKLYASPC